MKTKEKKPRPDPTRSARAARYRAATKEAGGAQINVRVGPEAAAVLVRMRQTMSLREAIEAAIGSYKPTKPA